MLIESERVTATMHALSGWAIERGLDLADLQVRRPALEDVYLELTEPPA